MEENNDNNRHFVFNQLLLNKALNDYEQPEYVMGVDNYDDKNSCYAYCFGRKVNGKFEILLSKTIRNENEFEKEVENLVKYFNVKNFFRSGD